MTSLAHVILILSLHYLVKFTSRNFAVWERMRRRVFHEAIKKIHEIWANAHETRESL